MKKFIVVLAMIFAIALLAQPKAQAGVFFRFGLPIRSLFRSSTGRRITQAVITMALTAMHITPDLTGAIDIGLTDTGATIENSAEIRDLQKKKKKKKKKKKSVLSVVHSKMMIVAVKQIPLSLARRLQHDFNAPIFLIAKGLVGGWCFLEWKAMRDDE